MSLRLASSRHYVQDAMADISLLLSECDVVNPLLHGFALDRKRQWIHFRNKATRSCNSPLSLCQFNRLVMRPAAYTWRQFLIGNNAEDMNVELAWACKRPTSRYHSEYVKTKELLTVPKDGNGRDITDFSEAGDVACRQNPFALALNSAETGELLGYRRLRKKCCYMLGQSAADHPQMSDDDILMCIIRNIHILWINEMNR
eukprot:12271319-Karenia_brevis.AAC.1